MGWIKANLDEDTHDQIRDKVNSDDRPTHDVAAELIKTALNNE